VETEMTVANAVAKHRPDCAMSMCSSNYDVLEGTASANPAVRTRQSVDPRASSAVSKKIFGRGAAFFARQLARAQPARITAEPRNRAMGERLNADLRPAAAFSSPVRTCPGPCGRLSRAEMADVGRQLKCSNCNYFRMEEVFRSPPVSKLAAANEGIVFQLSRRASSARHLGAIKPVLVHGPALDRHAVPHGCDRLVQPCRAIGFSTGPRFASKRCTWCNFGRAGPAEPSAVSLSASGNGGSPRAFKQDGAITRE
jgi:hypothetical protein